MNRRTAVARLFTLITIAAMTASPFVTAVAQAREGQSTDRELRIKSDPQRESAGMRSFRRVDVGSLPAATGNRPSHEPHLGRPDWAFSPAAPDLQGAVAPAPVQTTSNGDPAINQATGFNGLPATGGEPPDPWVAVGPEHVFQAVNTTFRISGRSGNTIQTVDMYDFFGLSAIPVPGGYQAEVFDPRVIYDTLHARWIAIEVSFDCYPVSGSTIGTGYIDVAISDGPNPTAGWGVLSIAYPDAVPDYPGLGTSTDKVVVSGNVFPLAPGGDIGCDLGPAFAGAEMDAMAWSQLMGTGVVNIDAFGTIGGTYFSWRPALQTPATSSTVFAIAERFDEGVAYARIDGNPASVAGSTWVTSDLTSSNVITPFALPPPPKQPGMPATIVDAVDARPTDAVWKGNKLAFVSTYPCDPVGGVEVLRDCVRVSELATSVPTDPTLIQDFVLAEEGADLFMGGIGYALNDDLHVVWTRSSENAGQYLSSYGAYQDAGSTNNTISNKTALSLGLGIYDGTRWGDYVGVAQDPQVPNAVWQANQYADVAAVAPNNWATEVTQLQTGGSSYVPITPLRILDTRPAYNIGLAGAFPANTPRTFQVAGLGGAAGIPTNAIAVTGNVTVAGQNAAGYVSVTPIAVANPLSSTINFPIGDNRANNVTLPLSADGKLAAVYKAPAARSTHLIVDITGYFLAGPEDATYSPVTPVRVLDSRPAFSIGLPGAFRANVPRQLNITARAEIPDDAVAITGNLTVVGQTRAGYLSITRTSVVNPTTSTLNFPLGDTRANGVSVPLNPSGGLWIVYKASGGTAHVILDVTGYYRNDPSGLLFYPLTPGRVMDTRAGVILSGLTGAFAANGPRRLDISAHWGVPASANSITGNLTVVNQTAAGYVSATLASQVNPTTSVLNFPLGDTRANGVTLPLNGTGDSFFVYKAPGGRTTHLILDLTGYFD